MAESDDEVPLPPERSEEELEARHAQEKEEMEKKAEEHLAAAQASGKGKKAKQVLEAAQRETEQWLYQLHVRQQTELEKLREHLEGPKASEPAPAAQQEEPEDTTAAEAERLQRKKEKALKKRLDKREKEAAKEAEKERERLEAGPSARETELVALRMKLAAHRPPLTIHDIAADGHCLYRSVGDQLRRFRPDAHSFKLPPLQVHEEIRALCAGALRKRSEAYEPFAELQDDEDFRGYCERVENSADWGGELELRALADELKVQIHVFRAEAAEPLVLGDTKLGGKEPLRVTFHKHYYALGEHYNSVVPLS